jgi:predicted aminopeptidase
LALASSLLAPGCYYGHVASGQLRLLLARESTEDVLADPRTPPRLREQLALVERARAYANELGLEVGSRYTSYVDWPGDRIVTSVVATHPGELDAAGFHFPLVGEVPYKGFFDVDAAENEARRLRAGGLDVCLVPVSAYSTLGFFDDPITTPMLQRSDEKLVETVVHELVHATVFVASQPEFNEGVARFVGQEAALRFYERDVASDLDAVRRVRARVEDDRVLAGAMLGFREGLASLYAAELDPARRGTLRAAREAEFREQLAQLPLAAGDASGLADRARLNDACLALGSTYAADAYRHSRVLEALGGDLPAFVARLRRSAASEDPRAAFFALETPAGAPPPAPRAATRPALP